MTAGPCATAGSTSPTSWATVGFGDVFGLLVDGDLGRPLPREEPGPEPPFSGDVRVDVQAGLALLGSRWSLPPLLDATPERARDDLARGAAAALALVARSARGDGLPPVPEDELSAVDDPVARFLMRWRGEADPTHVRALDAYWVSAAEHGLNASTFTARVVASTGADAAAALSAAVGAMSGPLHGGAPARVLPMIAEVERIGRRRRRGGAASSTAPSASWASATASTAPRTRGPASCAAPPGSSPRRASRPPPRSRRPP